MSQPPEDPYQQRHGQPPHDPYQQRAGQAPQDPYPSQQQPGHAPQNLYQQQPGQAPQDPYPYQQRPGQPPQDPYQQQPGWPQQGQTPYSPPGGQPSYAGPPRGHATPRPRKRHLVRNILLGTGGFIVVLAVVGQISNNGSRTTASNTTAVAPSSAAPSRAAAVAQTSSTPSPPNCTSQVTDWRDGGGLDNLNAMESDLNTLSGSLTTLGNDMSSGADVSADEASVQQAAASLQSDDQTAQANLPPSCVPGMRKNYSVALTDYNKFAIECTEAITEVSNGNTSIAMSNISAAGQAMDAGNGKIAKAAADVKAYTNS